MADNRSNERTTRRRLSGLPSALHHCSRKETGMSVIATSERLVEVSS